MIDRKNSSDFVHIEIKDLDGTDSRLSDTQRSLSGGARYGTFKAGRASEDVTRNSVDFPRLDSLKARKGAFKLR